MQCWLGLREVLEEFPVSASSPAVISAGDQDPGEGVADAGAARRRLRHSLDSAVSRYYGLLPEEEEGSASSGSSALVPARALPVGLLEAYLGMHRLPSPEEFSRALLEPAAGKTAEPGTEPLSGKGAWSVGPGRSAGSLFSLPRLRRLFPEVSVHGLRHLQRLRASRQGAGAQIPVPESRPKPLVHRSFLSGVGQNQVWS